MGKLSSYPTDNNPSTDDYVPTIDAQSGGNKKVLISKLVDLVSVEAGDVDWGGIGGTLSDQTDLAAALNGKSSTGHTHDDRYYTESEIDSSLSGKASTSHTHAQSDVTNLTTDLAGKQPLDSDLTSIAAISPSNDDVIQRKAGAWINRTMAQVKSDLSLSKSDVGLGNVDNTSDATKNSASVALTNKDLTSGTNTFPTFNQNTTGSAATLTTTRTIWGQNFNGSANVTGDITLSTNSITMTGSIGATGARVTKGWFADIESTNAPTVGGTALPTASSTTTLTNKRVTPRVGTTASSATPTINTDNVDYYSITAQAADITSFTTNLSGTPTDGQKLWISITGTAARAIAWGTGFEASTVALPTTTVTTNRLDVGFIYNSVTSKWRCVATA